MCITLSFTKTVGAYAFLLPRRLLVFGDGVLLYLYIFISVGTGICVYLNGKGDDAGESGWQLADLGSA